MEAQDSGNGQGREAQAIECRCDFCQCINRDEYWQELEGAIESLSRALITCIEVNHIQGFNWLCSHVEGVLQAARDQLVKQTEQVH